MQINEKILVKEPSSSSKQIVCIYKRVSILRVKIDLMPKKGFLKVQVASLDFHDVMKACDENTAIPTINRRFASV